MTVMPCWQACSDSSCRSLWGLQISMAHPVPVEPAVEPHFTQHKSAPAPCMSAVTLQAILEGLLPQRCAEQQGAALFQHLKQLWPAQAHPVRHAQVLLLQAHLTAPLGTQDIVISLVQQALALLVHHQVQFTLAPVAPKALSKTRCSR